MKTLHIVFICLLLFVLYKIISGSYEYFSIVYNDPPIEPTFFDRTTGTMMTGVEFSQPLKWEDNTKGQDAYKGSFDTNYFLDDGNEGKSGLLFNLCDKSCCMPQYPLPFNLEDNGILAGGDYVGSNYTCNNSWQSAGCVCMTKEQKEFLENRGGNTY